MNFKRICKIIILIVAASFLLGSASCAVSSNELTTQEEEAVYAEVIRQLATVDDTYGGNLNPLTIYVISNTGDGTGRPEDEENPSRAIPESVQSEITGLLDDLPGDIIWIEKRQDAEFEDNEGAEVKNRGAIISIGNIQVQADGSVQVAGSIYTASMAAGGTTYILKKIDGAWRITGRVGGFWIS